MAWKADFRDPARLATWGFLGSGDVFSSQRGVDEDYLQSEAKVREYLDQLKNQQYQSAYTPDWLKTRQSQIDLQTRGLLDETQAGQLAEQRSAWDQLAMSSGLDQGAAERLGARAAQNAQMNRQNVMGGQAQQNLEAQLQDYGLRAQDIAAKNAFEQNKWQQLVNAEGGLAVGRQQAKKGMGGLFGGGGLFGTGMFS